MAILQGSLARFARARTGHLTADVAYALPSGVRAVNILIASSEVAPFSKTGGLADVCGALPAALADLGHQVTVVTPAYRDVVRKGWTLEPTGVSFDVPIGSKVVSGRFLSGCFPDSQVPILFVEQPEYFDRSELYGQRGQDYKDNCERFVFFSRAIMESIRLLDLSVDVLHCNDWQTGLVPAYLRIEFEHARGYENIVSLMTLHNMAYQGRFWHWDMLLTGIDWKYFNWNQMEFWGDLNLLKTGIVFADAINTVSPRYAQEIQRPPFGCGLEGVLQHRSTKLSGIINGVDYGNWDPATDPSLVTNYDVTNWRSGKAACKAKLQSELGLRQSPDTPLIGLIGRLADQKGWDLVAQVMKRWVLDSSVQWAILGTGDPKYHDLLYKLYAGHTDRVAVRLEFSDRLAHQIEAAADVFLMPSLYEPCGLNQLYSLKYGAVPVVHETGGLADTICDATPQFLAAKIANGFSFRQYDPESLEETLRRACGMYMNHAGTWGQLVETGMRQDWSWRGSAEKYVELYKNLIIARNLSLESLAASR